MPGCPAAACSLQRCAAQRQSARCQAGAVGRVAAASSGRKVADEQGYRCLR